MEAQTVMYIVMILQILCFLAIALTIFYFDDALKRFSTYCWNESYVPFETSENTEPSGSPSKIVFPD